MIRALSALTFTSRQDIRGGSGPAQSAEYLRAGEMEGVLAAGRTVLAPGTSIGEHLHADTEEIYLVLEGRGQGVLDGVRFPVGPGDLFLCKAGHRHGILNDSDAPMTFMGLMTRG